MSQRTAVLFAPDPSELPEGVEMWLRAQSVGRVQLGSGDALTEFAMRSRPRLVVFDGRSHLKKVADAVGALKRDSYTGIVPSVVLVRAGNAADLRAAFQSGADEVLHDGLSSDEVGLRLGAMMARSDRDTLVHPSTRLPGTIEIEAEMSRRLAAREVFAVCYADLDHFKEYNDRYGYYEGDRVIRIVAHILHDVVKGMCGTNGFVGHIGGDDFIFMVPVSHPSEVCAEIVNVFDQLSTYQYSAQDRAAGYFFGKDRRGQLHRVPLMTISIGVVTNERRQFISAAQISELATEMKTYAKTLTGSVYTVDRRDELRASDSETPLAAGEQRRRTQDS
jgi:diguanylate cyclase (GGDEF)-like protein